MSYDNWIIERWPTPISDVSDVMVQTIVDNVTLKIVFYSGDETDIRRWEFEFARVPAYRNILESYRLCLWTHLGDTRQHCGSSFIVRNSDWIAELRQSEALINEHFSVLQHYVMTTWDDVLEVLAPEPPSIRELR